MNPKWQQLWILRNPNALLNVFPLRKTHMAIEITQAMYGKGLKVVDFPQLCQFTRGSEVCVSIIGPFTSNQHHPAVQGGVRFGRSRISSGSAAQLLQNPWCCRLTMFRFGCSCHFQVPSGDQTWLAGKSLMNEGFIWKISDKLSIFQQAMFDYRRVSLR